MKRSVIPLVIASCVPAGAIEIEIDYTYDTNGFFNQPGAKACLRAVADYYETLIHDTLGRIDHTQWPAGNTWSAVFKNPATGSDISISNLVVPANTLVIFAGGRSLGSPAGQGGPGGYSAAGNSQAWFDLLASRGETGALAVPKTDFGPWGGMITFDTADDWDFSTSGPVNGEIPFVSIAMHEFGHLLGIGTAGSWTAKTSGSNFTGPRSVAAFGGNVPLNGTSHWRNDGNCAFPDGYVPDDPDNVLSKAYGSFGAPHGFAQIALMDPSTCTAGTFHKVMTDLDLAALADIGWELVPPLRWQSAQVNPNAGPVAFNWNTTTGFTYRVEVSTTLQSWGTIHSFTGNGDPTSYTHSSPPVGKAFYRLNTNPPPAAPLLFAARTSPAPASMEPVIAEGCRLGPSSGAE